VMSFSLGANIPNSPLVSYKLFALSALTDLANEPVSAG
jgi:hypothetical protein